MLSDEFLQHAIFVLLVLGLIVFLNYSFNKITTNAKVYYSKLKALVRLIEIKVDRLNEENDANQYYKVKQIELQAIFDNSPVGIITFDAKGNCINTNTKYQILSGRTNYENLGNGWILSIFEDDREEVFSRWRKFVEEQTATRLTYRMQTMDGSVMRVEAITSLVKDSNKLFGFVCSVIDIHDIWQKSEELNIAKISAESAISIKNEFMANLSHEIGNPMNAIIGLTNLTLHSDISAENKENLENVLRSAENLWRKISGLLEFSKIEAGKVELNESTFSLHNCITKSIESLSSKLNNKEITYSLYIDKKIPQLLIGDDIKLSNVLTQIIQNSIKYAKTGGYILIEVDTKKVVDEDICLRFSIKDDGIGISADIIDHLFTPFANNKVFHDSESSGLGLAITKKLVQLLGGDISVESQEGMGASFTFTVKFKISSLKSLDRSDDYGAVKLNKQFDITGDFFNKNLSVLLVEDNHLNQVFAFKTLTKWGHSCMIANNGAEALDLIRNNPDSRFDIVLMDCLMPVMDGFAAARNIRKYETEKKIQSVPIIAFTASTMLGEKSKCLEAGMNDFLAKPFNHVQLAEVINAWSRKEKTESSHKD